MVEDRESIVKARGEDAGGQDKFDEEGIGAVELGSQNLGVDLFELNDGGGGGESCEDGGVCDRVWGKVGIRRKS